MKVHLIKQQTVRNYIDHHAAGKRSFEFWLTTIKYADWERPEDIQSTFSTIDFLGHGSDRIVFDIGGNNFRVICKYYFGDVNAHLFIKWIGTHAEYDELCHHERQYNVDFF